MQEIIDSLNSYLSESTTKLSESSTVEELNAIKPEIIGKTSPLKSILSTIKHYSIEEKKLIGNKANEIKIEIEAKIKDKYKELKSKQIEENIRDEQFDLTLPAIPSNPGILHPTTVEMLKIVDIFKQMGFTVFEPYLIDSDDNNFNMLGIPENHPARGIWDTLRINEKLSLIVHTSSMQNRIMKSGEPPIRAIVPGKTFRNEKTDPTHEHSFFQVEGVYIDKNIKIPHMIGLFKEFLKNYFEHEVEIKIQPTYFPFVEPGMEIMIKFPVKPEKGVEQRWLEVIPCGMIHPNVLKNGGINPEEYSGFAWGFGLDRMIMLKKSLNDVRYFHSGRLDFTSQFNEDL